MKKITVQEFEKMVWSVDRVVVVLRCNRNRLVKPYHDKPMDGECIVNDLVKRIWDCIGEQTPLVVVGGQGFVENHPQFIN